MKSCMSLMYNSHLESVDHQQIGRVAGVLENGEYVNLQYAEVNTRY
jgi:hypothetical protein